MKRQDINKLRQQNPTQLAQEVITLKKQLVEARMQKTMGELKNLKQPAHLKHQIAIINTIIKEKELTPEEPKSPSVKKSKTEAA
jgi:ribosomal protein L29